MMQNMKYMTPTSKIIELNTNMMCSSDNGNHYGWDNPHNPHYCGYEEDEDED